MYTLFVDDERNPADVSWMAIPFVGETVVVRSYNEFVDTILERGLPAHVSFDYDLADFEEDGKELTGYHCAKWLVGQCIDHRNMIPSYTVHSMNPIGKINIREYIDWAVSVLEF